MKIICAGLPKTGTKSITRALRHLGFTVFDYEEQFYDSPDFLDHWVDVFQNGAQPDVKRIYQNADVVVDAPGSFFYEEILEAFPDCKVILSERDEDSWMQSFAQQRQAFEKMAFLSVLKPLSSTGTKFEDVVGAYLTAIVGSRNFKSTYVFKKRYRIHNHRVKSIVPADKLLVYNVKQGWKPLCDFLECKVPTIAFPHENMKGELANAFPMTKLGRQVYWEIKRGVLAIGSVLAVVLIIILAICFSQ